MPKIEWTIHIRLASRNAHTSDVFPQTNLKHYISTNTNFIPANGSQISPRNNLLYCVKVGQTQRTTAQTNNGPSDNLENTHELQIPDQTVQNTFIVRY